MVLEHYEIIDGDKIVISKSELENLIIYCGQKSQKSLEDGDFYNVTFYNGKCSLLIDILKTFEK